MAESGVLKRDWFSPPGETVTDILDEQGLSVEAFATRLGEPVDAVKDLLSGRAPIDKDRASRLARTLGGTPTFWTNRELDYRAGLQRMESEIAGAQTDEWLSSLPIRDMRRLGWIDARNSRIDIVTQSLRFFGVPTVQKWHERYDVLVGSVALRTSPSFESESAAVAAWLRQGELEASRQDRAPWDVDYFREELHSIRSLSRKRDPQQFLPLLQKQCSTCGVAVVVVRAPENCRASGAAFFSGLGRPVVLLSARHLSDDHFWFTFFHEAGHLILHGEDGVFIDIDDSPRSPKEQEANQFAADELIPNEFRSEFFSLRTSHTDVIRFARSIGVSPGIVVGQLQFFDLLSKRHLNRLKRRYEWRDGTLVSREMGQTR